LKGPDLTSIKEEVKKETRTNKAALRGVCRLGIFLKCPTSKNTRKTTPTAAKRQLKTVVCEESSYLMAKPYKKAGKSPKYWPDKWHGFAPRFHYGRHTTFIASQ
jgi:hypothetical protein